MQVYQCDFCNTIKACSSIEIESKKYDVCAACKTELEKKLEGKGEAVPFRKFGRRWNDYPQPMPYYQPFPIYRPVYVPISPVIVPISPVIPTYPTITFEWQGSSPNTTGNATGYVYTSNNAKVLQ